MVDAANLKHCVRRRFGMSWVVNFQEFEKCLRTKCNMVEKDELSFIFYVAIPPGGSDGTRKYVDAIVRRGWRCRKKEMKISDTAEQGEGSYPDRRMQRYTNTDWDAGFAVDALVGAHRGDYDTLILVSGDGDLFDVVNAVRLVWGKNVVVAGVDKSLSGMLVGNVDAFIILDEKIVSRSTDFGKESERKPNEEGNTQEVPGTKPAGYTKMSHHKVAKGQ